MQRATWERRPQISLCDARRRRTPRCPTRSHATPSGTRWRETKSMLAPRLEVVRLGASWSCAAHASAEPRPSRHFAKRNPTRFRPRPCLADAGTKMRKASTVIPLMKTITSLWYSAYGDASEVAPLARKRQKLLACSTFPTCRWMK